jgi:hypothetical protein
VQGDYLFSLAEGGEFLIFNRMKGNLIKKVQFDCHFTDFIHPSTYVNKLLFSGSQGKEDAQKPCMQLWNIMNHEKLFDFNDIVSKDSDQ